MTILVFLTYLNIWKPVIQFLKNLQKIPWEKQTNKQKIIIPMQAEFLGTCIKSEKEVNIHYL